MAEIPYVNITYGQGTVPLYMDPALAQWQLIAPEFAPALPDPQADFRQRLESPIGTPPLKDLIKAEDRVVIVTSDGTRPVPNHQLIPWLMEELPCPPENIIVLLGNGTHRENTADEIEAMFGTELINQVIIANHIADDPRRNQHVGAMPDGRIVELDRMYTEADKRIILGFIEPHFFAGFSGGAKAVIPGIASSATIHSIHRADLIGNPDSTWGNIDNNPLRLELEEMVGLCPPDLMVNVILNREKQITGCCAGHYIEAHRTGCEAAREEAMTPVKETFPVVITSNSGYPLDQNLYQTVKGISAASRIIEPGGVIFVCSECSDGIPDGGLFADIMQKGACAAEVLQWIMNQPEVVPDQWQAQALAAVLAICEVRVYTAMPDEKVEACKMRKVSDLQSAVEQELTQRGSDTRVAVMPDGPLTIPYLA